MNAPQIPMLLKKNMEALIQGGQTQTWDWLTAASASKGVTEIEGEGGHWILVVDGQSQASRRDPIQEAQQWLEKALKPEENIVTDKSSAGQVSPKVLFGLGNPWVANLLLETGPLLVYEPDPRLWQAVLARHDFSSHLAGSSANQLTIISPQALAEKNKVWSTLAGLATILVHPPAQRRACAQLINFKRLWLSSDQAFSQKPKLNQSKSLKIMVIPPLSGGSWPVAVALSKAVENEGHKLHFMNWGHNLGELEKSAHQVSPQDSPTEKSRLTAQLFKETAEAASQATRSFSPDLIIALAQAPLDASAVEKLRGVNSSQMAFWAVEDLNLFPYVAEVAPAYDIFFHIQKDFSDNLARSWGLSATHYLPLAADAQLFRPRPEARAGEYGAALSFMGAGYPNRRLVMRSLVKDYWPQTGRPAADFKVFGSNWRGAESDLGPHLFEGGRRVSSGECAMIYAGSDINLNIHSSFNSQVGFTSDSLFVNPRTFEIAAAGGFQIVDHRPLLAELFTDQAELAVAQSPAQLPELIDHFLKNPHQMRSMGQAARQRVLEEHTYDHRLRQILAHLGWSKVDK